MRYFIILIMITCIYGCIQAIAGYYSYILPPTDRLYYILLHYPSPWILLLLAPFSWHVTRQWRVMDAVKQTGSLLSRGSLLFTTYSSRPSYAEKFCKHAWLLSFITLPYWFRSDMAEWIVIIILIAWGFIRLSVYILRGGHPA